MSSSSFSPTMTTYVFRMSIVAKFYTDVFSLPIVEPNPTIIIGYVKLPDSNYWKHPIVELSLVAR